MCKLIVGMNKSDSPQKLEEIKKILKVQKADVFKEPHGMAAMVVDKSGKVKIWREYIDYDKVYNELMKALDTARIFVLHGRTSTGGYGEDNVHLFEKDGCVMAHNGTVGKYIRGQAGFHVSNKNLNNFEPCDTLKFLGDLPKPLTTKNIEDFAKEKDLYGIAFIYDKQNKQGYFIANRKPEVILDPDIAKSEYAVFFSYKPTVESKESTRYYENVFGVKVVTGFETEELTLKDDVKEGIVGTYKIEV